MSWKGVITNAGRALIDQWELGGHTLTIDKATVGSGNTVEANMRVATALNNEIGQVSIVKNDTVEGGARFQIQITASTGSAYTAREVGLWGHLDSGSTVLIALHQDSEGIPVPTAATMPDFSFTLYLIHAISNSDDLEVNVDTSAVVSAATLETALEDLAEDVLDDVAKKYRNVVCAECSTSASTKDKTATVTTPGTFSLSVGQIVSVKFTNTNSYSATSSNHVTLDVGGTGAKPVYYGDGMPEGDNPTAFGRAGYVNLYIYDGTYWVWIGSSTDNDTTYSNATTSAAGLMSATDKSRVDTLNTDAVRITEQTFTAAQKEQARANIKAISEEDAGFTNLIEITLPGITSLPKTFTVQGMTANHELVQDGFALVTPESSCGSQWTLTPGNGTIQVTGTFIGSTSTTIKASMCVKKKKVTGVAQ